MSRNCLARFAWAHFLQLIRIDDPWKRAFYENECLKGHWSKRQLQRQIGSLLFECTGLSKDKAAVVRRARRQEPQETVEDLLRDPYVLEFTGLAERPEYLSRIDRFVGACLQAIPRTDRLQAGSYGRHRAFALRLRQQSPIASLRLSGVEAASAPAVPSRRPAARKTRSSAKRTR